MRLIKFCHLSLSANTVDIFAKMISGFSRTFFCRELVHLDAKFLVKKFIPNE